MSLSSVAAHNHLHISHLKDTANELVKVKSLCLIKHHDVLGKWRYSSTHS